VQFEIDADRADAFGDEAIMLDGKADGWVTSGGYAATTGKSVALGYVETAYAEQEGGFAVEIIGVPRAARRLAAPLFDPEGTRLRA
jgi:dimethylglycine dehydrogenase